MLRCLYLIFFIIPALVAKAGIEVPDSKSKNGEFALFIATDKDKKDYEMDSCPAMWIEHLKTKKHLVSFDYRADPSSDTQPLRGKCQVLWSPNSESVVVQFSERHYSQIAVFRLIGSKPGPQKFVECVLPKDDEIIKSMVPRFHEFRSRWFQTPEKWIDQTTLVYNSGTTALITPDQNQDNGFEAVYRFYLDLASPHTPIVRRIEYAGEN